MFKFQFKINNLTDYITYYFFLLSVPLIIIFPKLGIIPLPGYWQGIQLSDLILAIFFIFLIFNIYSLNFNNEYKTYGIYIFFIYVIFNTILTLINSTAQNYQENVHGVISLNVTIVNFVRFSEFVVFIILSFNFFNNKKYLFYFFQFYIIINFAITIFQELNLIGFINSRGYFPPGDIRLGGRPMGLTGGPWELGSTMSIAYFALYFIEKKLNLRLLIYLVLTLTCLIFAETKSTLIGFVIALIFIEADYKKRLIIVLISAYIFANIYGYIDNIYLKFFFVLSITLIGNIFLKNYLINFIIFITILITPNLILYISNELIFVNKILSLDFIYLSKLMYNFFIYSSIPNINATPDVSFYYSMIIRLQFWLPLLIEFKSNLINIIFGLGNSKIYYESFILRCLFTFGIFGSVLLSFYFVKFPFFILIYTIFAGITFDLFFSSKVFFMTVLFFISYSLYLKEKNNYKNAYLN